MLTGAATAYGLTEGTAFSDKIGLTSLAKRIVRPLQENDDLAAKREVFLKPTKVREFLTRYNGSPLPKDDIAKNVLATMGVPEDRAAQVFQMIVEQAKGLGLTQEIKDRTYVNLEGVNVSAASEESQELGPKNSIKDESSSSTEKSTATPAPAAATSTASPLHNRRVFITHGKNKNLVEPIKKLLQFGELDAVVSVEKQSVSQPVPDKVMNDMRTCGAAIIHVDAEQRLMDSEAKEHIVLNPNVLIEIGAAMALFDRRFILLVKEGISLPSNLQGLFEVRYSGDTLDGTATIRLLEAINEMKRRQATSS